MSVAPYVGAWIETIDIKTLFTHIYVAPYVGAWIETQLLYQIILVRMSHPTWVRGLKHPEPHVIEQDIKSHPTWVRGLKHVPLAASAHLPGRTLRGCVD